MRVGQFLIETLAAWAIGLCAVGAAAAQTAGPPAGYVIDEEFTQNSPDGSVTIEQYVNKATDDWKWQFWARAQGTLSRLGSDAEEAGYPGDFRFTADLKWIVRMQKEGSGEQTLFLYRRDPQGYVAATRQPLADLAWAFMKTRPEWRKVSKAPEYHIFAGLRKGLQDNYRALGVDWPTNRYIVIGLSGDADLKGRKPSQTGVVNGWWCRYDLETGKFDVPALFARDNAKALVPQ